MGIRPKKCKMCGEKFIPTRSNNTICPKLECKAAGRKITYEKLKKKEKERAARKAREAKNKPESLDVAGAKARAEGLSYGQRELKLWLEKNKLARG